MMRYPSTSQWLFVIVIFLLSVSLLGRIIFSLLGNRAIIDLIGKITAISIVVLIALFVTLYLVADWKFKKAMKDHNNESRDER